MASDFLNSMASKTPQKTPTTNVQNTGLSSPFLNKMASQPSGMKWSPITTPKTTQPIKTVLSPADNTKLQLATYGMQQPTTKDVDKKRGELNTLKTNVVNQVNNPNGDTTDYTKRLEQKEAELKRLEPIVPKDTSKTAFIDPLFKGVNSAFSQMNRFTFNSPLSISYAPAKLVEKLTGVNLADAATALPNSNAQYFQNKVEQSQALRGKEYDTYAKLAEGVGAALPQAIVAVMSGGLSAAEALPALGGNAGLGTAITTGLSKMVQTPTFTTSFAQQYGSSYDSAIASGASEESAQLAATLTGLINSGIEMTGGLEVLPAALRGGNKNAVLEWVKSSLSEGKEEVVQGVIERLTQKMTYDKDKPLVSLTNPNAVFNPNTAKDEAIGGAVIGGILGGGQVAANKVSGNLTNVFTKPTTTPIATKPTTTQPINTVLNNASNTTNSVVTPQNALQATTAQGASTVAPQTTNALRTNLTAQNAKQIQPDGLGAADAGFDVNGNKMTALVDKYGLIKDGESPITADRVVELPKQTSDDKLLSQTVRTAMEAPVTTNETAEKIEPAVLSEIFSYEKITDKSALAKAESTITDKGWQTALKDWTADVRSGKVSKDITALGWTLYNNAANSGNAKEAVDILTDLVKSVRSGAQSTQAVRLLKKMAPEYQLYAAQRSVSNLQEELTRQYGDKAPNLKIDKDMAQKYLDALKSGDKAAAREALTDLYKNIAKQMPSNFADKWNAWRYMAMLTNPITHIKNIVSNTVFRGERFIKDVLATSIEMTANKLSPNSIDRSKAFLTRKDSALIKEADAMYAEDAEQIYRYGKYNEWDNVIQENRTIFKNNLLEKGRKLNTEALTAEDAWVSRPAYVKALASYMKANGATSLNSAGSALLDKGRAYAISTAQKASYRDSNAVSDFVANFKFRGKNPVGNAANALTEGVLPFRRTPANVLVAGIEYSPVGFVTTLAKHANLAYKGEFDAATFIDDISANLTGTAVLGLGMLLAKLGIISVGGTGDDKEDKFSETQGNQQFAINIGGKSYTIPWLAPPAMALFMGVSVYNKLNDKSENGITMKDALKVATDISNPVLETSMLSSMNDFLEGFSFAKQSGTNTIYYALSQAAMGYLGQAIPTLGGRISNIINSDRRTYFTDSQSGLPTDIQYFLQRQQSKIPGLSSALPKYVDQWGRTQSNGSVAERIGQNILSPGYLKTVNTSAMETELQRLYTDYAKENKVNVLPPASVDKYFSNNGEKVYMTADEYTEYKIISGQNSYKELTKLTASAEYKKMTDEQKADAVSDIYSASAEKAKTSIMETRGEMRLQTSADGEKLASYVDLGLSEKQAYTVYKALDTLKATDTDTLKYQKVSEVMKQSISQQQKTALVASFFTEHDEDGNVKSESLLPYLTSAPQLITMYKTSKNPSVASMAIPSSFTLKSVEYDLTTAEKQTFKNAYVTFFNNYFNNAYTADQIVKIREKAYEAAKIAVYQSRQ